ncbi:serrate RNA effector molecule homolog [Hydra vulgaris]|uniref:Serrate RNA effector molecule homolog n=1 Tax=Hydra vulgaris TaxID=6087 RepID=A0ABM4BSR0_HYDVU
MGDSDEEYDRRRGRDKFRGERNDYDARRPPPRAYDRARGERVRTSHENNNWENKASKRDYYGRDAHERRDSFGRNSSPPSKRSRREWEEQSPWRGSDSNALMPHDNKINGSPSLMGFKEFILQQEDDIDESEAIRRYQEYKVEFKRTQINDFFVLQKDKEWFKEKYHPIESSARKAVIRNGLRKRLRVFLDLYEAGYIDNVSLNIIATSEVLKFLDRVIIKLEGGSKEDLDALDIPPVKDKDVKTDGDGALKDDDRGEKKQSEEHGVDDGDDTKEPLPPGMEDDEELEIPGIDNEEKSEVKYDGVNDKKNDEETNDGTLVKNDEEKYVYDGLHMKRPVSLFMRNIPSNVSRHDLVTVCERYPGYLRMALSDPSPDRRWARRAWATFEHLVNIKDICWNLSNIRIKECELAPVVNRDVSHRIRPVNGITCSPMTMLLDAKLALDLIKILDKKFKLYEKEDLSNNHVTEIPTENSVNKDVDDTGEVEESKENKEEKVKKKVEENFDLPDENPIILNLPSEIVEAVPMKIKDEEDGKIDHSIVVDKKLEKSLDLLLLYLRVVHCVDYYNANEYLHEDEMPMRCGIMHVRDQPILSASKKDVDEWFQNIKTKLEHIFNDDELADDDEAVKLGKKDEEIEVENFIKANTQEITPDKWLCPLSGKKFRGPDFIRKHIMMKHLSSVENVKTEVMFFNNYVYDSKRPCFPDPKLRVNPAITTTFTPVTSNRTWVPSARQPASFATPRPPYNASVATPHSLSTSQPPLITQETYGRMSTYPPKQRRGGSAIFRDRKVIKYRDLDAPEESDFF